MKDKKSNPELYNHQSIESYWQKRWIEEKIFSPDLKAAKKPFYNLMMFPYPSAESMHVGNMYAFTGADVYGRFKRMQGYDVFEPIGLDGFGIHGENYALKIGKHPMDQAKKSEENFYRQMRATGNAYDWQRTLETYDPDYYKWTQWIFIQLFKKGLACRQKAKVNWCPSCKTVLADEQVIEGKCERCSSLIEKKDLEQWFFKITQYAERLLKNIDALDWTEKVKIAQRQWIGKSEGVTIEFRIRNLELGIKVFTTRPDTLFGATFLVLSPEHPIFQTSDFKHQISDEKREEIYKYVQEAKKKTEQERIAEGKEKTGVFTGLYAINPVNKEKIPIWIADYVLMGYGTGAIMAVPAHDQRDFEFAKKYGLEIIQVIAPLKGKASMELKEAYTGDGKMINSGDWNDFYVPDAMPKIIDWLEEKRIGKRETQYHLRDWLISRQRYWGPPIPMIYCEKCEWQPVPDKDLPVILPKINDYKPLGTGKSPLATYPDFYKIKCPNCGGQARRETDVSDNFLDSAWYFLRYTSTDVKNGAFDTKRVKKWLPVNMYIGGAEHSVLHLLYSRFITMFLHDLGLIDFEEPFSKFFAHGLLIKEGTKMSKSRGNVVVPDIYIKKFGADTLRCYLMFLGPFSQGGDFYDTGIEGMYRFIKRVWKALAGPVSVFPPASARSSLSASGGSNELRAVGSLSIAATRMMHKTIKKVTEDISALRYNTAIAGLMQWYNYLSKQNSLSEEEIITFLKLLAPFAPHMTEELWYSFHSRSRDPSSIHTQSWPVYDPKYLEEDEVTIVVQIDGKLREVFRLQTSDVRNKKLVEEKVKKLDKVRKYIEGKKIGKVVYIAGKVINFVTE